MAAQVDIRLEEVVGTLRRIAVGEVRNKEASTRPCEVIHGSHPVGTTCLDVQTHAADMSNRYNEEWRGKVLSPEYPCARCQARTALAAVESADG